MWFQRMLKSFVLKSLQNPSVHFFTIRPHSQVRLRFLFNDEHDGGYNKIFGDGEAKWEKMPEEEFRLVQRYIGSHRNSLLG